MPHTILKPSVLSVACALALVSACDLEDPEAFDDIALVDVDRQSFFDDYGCELECGTNSKKILGNAIAELDLNHHANGGGWVYDGFLGPDGTPMDLEVVDYRLIARPLPTTTRPGSWTVGGYASRRPSRSSVPVALAGNALVGSKILFHHVNTPLKQHALRIDGYSSQVKFWIEPHSTLHMYKFAAVEWAHWGGSYVEPLCGNAEIDDPAWGNLDNYAAVFEGDRYNGANLTVTSDDHPAPPVVVTNGGGERRWFNLGCAGYAGAKLLALRQTSASATDSYRTPLEERQALVKALTGDVCGDGQALTETGTPLYYRVESGGWNFGCVIKAMEAVWDENGAVCVNEFRLPGRAYGSAARACGIESCTGAQLTYWKDHGRVLTSLPDPFAAECWMFEPPATPVVGGVFATPTFP